jgi:hypothetical protein
MDVVAIVISFVALVATLRKKEFGKFVLIRNVNPVEDIRLRLIKSDVYECKFKLLTATKIKIDIKHPNGSNFEPYISINELNPKIEISHIPADSIIKIANGSSKNFRMTYCDKYGNWYCQSISKGKINRRYHKNFWNLTFAGA